MTDNPSYIARGYPVDHGGGTHYNTCHLYHPACAYLMGQFDGIEAERAHIVAIIDIARMDCSRYPMSSEQMSFVYPTLTRLREDILEITNNKGEK